MQFFDSVGLGDLKEEMYAQALLKYVCKEPDKVFNGYRGFYAYNTMGPVEFSCHIVQNDEGTANKVIGLSMHVMGNEFSTLPIGDNGVLDEDEDELSRCVFFETKDGGQIPIRLVMADVLPSYAPGTRVEMQLASFSLDVNYYKNDDDWQTKRGGELFGKPVSIADGAILSLGTDDTCRIKGRVKRVVEMQTISPKRTAKYTDFLALYVDTVIGEMPIYHTIDMVDTAERDLVRPGSIIDVIAVISADVAIGEYQGGAIFDEKHLLMLIRDCVERCDLRRLRKVIADDCEMNGHPEVFDELATFVGDPHDITIELDDRSLIKSIRSSPSAKRSKRSLKHHPKNEETALRAIKLALESNDWSSLYDSIAENCEYVRQGGKFGARGRSEVIALLNRIAAKCVEEKVRTHAYLFTVTGHPSGNDRTQPIGKRGVLALYNDTYAEAKAYDALFFVDIDDDGLIERIYIANGPHLINVEDDDDEFESVDDTEDDDFEERKIPTPDPSEDFQKAFFVAGKHIQHHVQKMGREVGWVRSHPYPPYIDHLSFVLGGEYFLVLIEDFHKKVEMPGNRRNLIRKARACNGRACVMPMVKSGLLMPHMTGYMTVKEIEELEWTPLLSHYGLIDAETGETVDLSKYDCDKDVELTDWELLEFAVSAIRFKLEKEQGRQIMSCQSDPDVLPNIWFVGDDGPEWVIVRAVRWPQERAELPSNWRECVAGAAKLSRHGNFASVSFASDDRRNSGRILRGKMADFEFPGLEKLTI